MEYCQRCLYPANARPTIIIDEEGVCSGCRVAESKQKIDWREREQMLREILEGCKKEAKKRRNIYDCIIPVSGGKDSHFQVYVIKEVYKLNPLLVTYNHLFNTRLGLRNLRNLIERFSCDLIRFTANPNSVRKVDRHMVKTVGDITWHYHSGIMTFPFQVAVKYNIPLIIWGEHGYSEVTGIMRLEDIPEFTKWCRQQHEMRGFEPEDLVNDPNNDIDMNDVGPYIYPSDEDIIRVGVRGIYLGNYMPWDHKKQVEFLYEKYNFMTAREREKTFSLFHKIDDHANDVHDFLKYLKFGYGRATDHGSEEIREGRMTRQEGIRLVEKYDAVKPSTLKLYCDFLGWTEQEFYDAIEHLRDPEIWQKRNGVWETKDSIANHIDDPFAKSVSIPQKTDRTFRAKNEHLYCDGKSMRNIVQTEDDSLPIPEDKYYIL